MAYVNFVNHCYVDTEVEMKEIYTSNHIWTLFENFTLDMAQVRAGFGQEGRDSNSCCIRWEQAGVTEAPPNPRERCGRGHPGDWCGC